MNSYKIIFAFIFITSFSIILKAQDESEKEIRFILKTDTTWDKEIFEFPLGFAQAIPYTGIEDARFPIGWGKIESPNFWSYAFAWNIDGNQFLTAKDLEKNLKLYFDGLMEITSNINKTELKNTAVRIHKNPDSNEVNTYSGNITTFDKFFTKKILTLNVQVEHYYCDQKNKSIILFRFSPKSFDEQVWLTLNHVRLESGACNL